MKNIGSLIAIICGSLGVMISVAGIVTEKEPIFLLCTLTSFLLLSIGMISLNRD